MILLQIVHVPPLSVIRNGVDTQAFTPKRNRSLLKDTPLESCDPLLLFVGRLAAVKGPVSATMGRT